MTKLNQIIAAEKGVKARTAATVNGLYHALQKPGLFNGLVRTYQPKDDEGDQLPPESTPVQQKVGPILTAIAAAQAEYLDIVATKDVGNTRATADVVVDGTVIIAAAPVPFLLFLEKQLVDVRTIISKIPVLDPSEIWDYDGNSATYRAEPVKTVRGKKIPRNHVKAEATERHPAQVEVFYEDVTVGYWTKVSLSGATTRTRVNELTDRVERLLTAVKFAREEANSIEVEQIQIGRAVFGYLFGGDN